jgi:hypothetical protein
MIRHKSDRAHSRSSEAELVPMKIKYSRSLDLSETRVKIYRTMRAKGKGTLDAAA